MNNNKNTSYYMELPYTIVLKRDDEGDFVGRIEELQGCVAHGADEIEAIRNLKKMQELWIQDCIDAGESVPVPREIDALPSGKWVQRVARSLHKKLAEKAAEEEVSLNQLVATILAEAVGSKAMQKCVNDGLIAAFSSRSETTASLKRRPGDGQIWDSRPWDVVGPQFRGGSLTHQLAGIETMIIANWKDDWGSHETEKEQ